MGKVNLSPFLRTPTLTSVLAFHDTWLNQSVTTTSNVLFNSVRTSGNLTVDGDFTVLGSRNISESSVVKYKSHILIVNDGEMGSGVQLNEAGIEIDRGMLENVRIVYREADRTFRVGKISSAQAIATREDVPLNGGLMVWDATSKSMLSTKTYPSDLHLTSTTASTGIGTGAFVVDGMSSFASDVKLGSRLYISGSSLNTSSPFLYTSSTNDLHIESPSAIALDAEKIVIPVAKPLMFGDASAIYTENAAGTSDLYISTNETGRVRFPSVQDASTKTTASVVFNGGVSVARTVLLGGDEVDYAMWASESNTLKIMTRNTGSTGCPTTVSILNNTIAPNTELQINGPLAYGYLSLKFSNDRFLIQPSSSASDLMLSSQNGLSQLVISSDGSTTLSGPLSLPLIPPSANEHAVSKLHLDDTTRTFACKIPARVATTSPVFISDCVAGAVVDGVTLHAGDRVFVKDEFDPKRNGLWVVVDSISTPVRSSDFKQGFGAHASVIFVAEGNINASSGWICTSVSPNDLVGINPLTFSRFTGLGQVVAGAGLIKSAADTIDANVDGVSVEIHADAIRISSNGISTGLVGGSGSPLAVRPQLPHITEVGTLTGNSEWNGKTLQVGYGGTGRVSYNTGALIYGNSTSGNSPLSDDIRLCWDAANGTLTVDGDVVISGKFDGGVDTITSGIAVSGTVNCSAVTVYNATISQNGARNVVTVTLEAIPIASHTKTALEFTLPNRSTPLVNRMDLFCTSSGECELDASDVNGIVNVENIIAVAVVNTKNVRLSFTSNESGSPHQFNMYLAYLTD